MTPLPPRRRSTSRFAAVPWVALAVGTEVLVRVGGFLLVLAIAAVVVWMLRPPPETQRSDPSEWDPTAEPEDEDDEFELFSPGTGAPIVETENGRTYEAHETKAIQAAADYLEPNDHATVADLKGDVFPNHPARHGDPDEWWTGTVRPGLTAITDAEIPPEEPPDAPDEGDVEDATDAEEDDPGDGERESDEAPPDWAGSDWFDHEVRGERTRGTLVEVRDGGRSAEFFVRETDHGDAAVEPASHLGRGQGDEWLRDAELYLRGWWRATRRELERER